MPRYFLTGTANKEVTQDYLYRELLRIQQSINDVYDGIIESQNKDPGGNENLFIFSDGTFDFGDGEGMYFRIGRQWYKLDARKVGFSIPLSGTITLVGNTNTVS